MSTGTSVNWRTSSYSIGGGECVEVASWRKSSRSAYNGSCVEVGAWRKASWCASGECVEVGQGDSLVGVRDTQDRDGPVLMFPAGVWREFTSALRET